MREVLVVRTPENVTFEHEIAALGSRATAWAIDIVVTLALAVLVSMALTPITSALGGLGLALQFVAVFLVQWGYGTVSEWAFGGKTAGKAVVGLRTVTDRGLRISFLQAATRNLVRSVDVLPGFYAVGGVSALFDPLGRRLGDLAAGTLVVRERRAPRPASFLPASDRRDASTLDPALVQSARRITPPERDVILALCLRREQLPLRVRHGLFEDLAAHLTKRLGVERPPHSSPERFVLALAVAVSGREAVEDRTTLRAPTGSTQSHDAQPS